MSIHSDNPITSLMEPNDHQRLIERLKRIETLFADQAATHGEKSAAGEAADRIRQRLEASALADPPVEFTFALRNPWSVRLFIALARRYNLRPYRYARQRRTSVTLRVPTRFVHQTFWPEFCELDGTLQNYLTEITERVIAESINQDASDIEVRPGQALPASTAVAASDSLP
jgi:hypothetical protein